jgi:hypothetical protein
MFFIRIQLLFFLYKDLHVHHSCYLIVSPHRTLAMDYSFVDLACRECYPLPDHVKLLPSYELFISALKRMYLDV